MATTFKLDTLRTTRRTEDTVAMMLSSSINDPHNYKSEADLKENAKEKEKAINTEISIAEKTCLCFMVDCTTSMSPWIKEVKKNIKFWSEKLYTKHTNMELHVAFVRYTDYDQPKPTRTTTFGFTTDMDQIHTFVDSISTPRYVGGDIAEDVFGGLDAVLKLEWPKAGTKVLIHITDAPCHGEQYHDPTVRDDYPGGDPGGLQLDDLIKQFIDKKIKYFFAYIDKLATHAMLMAFNKSMLSQSRGIHSIQQFNASEPSNLLDGVYQSVTCSIGATLTALRAEESTRKLRNYTIVNEIPEWDDLPIQEVMVTPPPDVGADTKLQFPSQQKKIKIAPHPFAEGKQKIAYHALDVDGNEHLVLKQSKFSDRKSNVIKRCLETAQTHAIASSVSAEFNRRNMHRANASEIMFAPVGVLQVTTTEKPQFYTYELYLGDGDYMKFNTNFHHLPAKDDKLNNTCQAFSHYSWEKSGKRQVICDLQGIKIGDSRVALTDPAIHDTNVLCHGNTNLGARGIQQFFRNHECNYLCRALGLKRPPDEAEATQ